MGSRNPDRVALSVRRGRCETVEQMIAQRWDVIAKCRTCGLTTHVDLKVIAIVRGPAFSLWNRTSRCRRVGCLGVVDFQGKAPGMAYHQQVAAEWPDGAR